MGNPYLPDGCIESAQEAAWGDAPECARCGWQGFEIEACCPCGAKYAIEIDDPTDTRPLGTTCPSCGGDFEADASEPVCAQCGADIEG